MTVTIPVMGRFARGYPDHVDCPKCGRCKPSAPPLGEQDDATYGPLAEALSTRFGWDAHFAAYTAAHADFTNAPLCTRRLTHRALGEYAAHMRLFIVDVEPAGHAPRTPEWDAQEAPKVERAIADGAYFYSTRGGYRLIWILADPFVIADEHDASEWSASYTAALETVRERYDIIGDATCKDWTRLYRLPHVTRDGEYIEPECTDNASSIGTWQLTRVAVPVKPLAAVADIDEGEPASPELLAHVRERLKQHGPAISGQNGNAHTFKACAMVIRGYALNEHDAVTVLNEWNETCQPPWDGDELRTVMDNAYNYGQGSIGEARVWWEQTESVRKWGEKHGAQPRAVAPQAPAGEAPKIGGVLGALFDLAPDWTTILAGNIAVALTAVANPYGAHLAQARAEIEAYNGDASAPQEDERPFFESGEDLFRGDDVPPRWLINSLLLQGGTAMIGAEPKASKTWAGTEMALALATGTPAFGKYDVAKPTSVAYFYTEDMRDAIRSRVRSLLKGRGLGSDSIARTFHSQARGRRIDVTRVEDCARIIASVRMIEQRSGKIGVIILDPLRNIHMRDEDKSGEMAAVFEHLKMIGTLLDCTIVIVHHSKKATQNASKRGGQKLRGSSAIHGFLDSAMYLSDTVVSDDGSTFTNTVESETKAGRSGGTFELTLKITDDERTRTAINATWQIGAKGETNATEDTQESWDELALDAIDAMVQAEARRKPLKSTKEIRDALKCNKNTLTLALRVAVQRGWLTKDRKTLAYRLTGPGREISRERHKVETVSSDIATAADTSTPPTSGGSAFSAWRKE